MNSSTNTFLRTGTFLHTGSMRIALAGFIPFFAALPSQSLADASDRNCGQGHLNCQFDEQALHIALEAQSLNLLSGEVTRVLASAQTAHTDYCASRHQGQGDKIDSKVRFASVEIARELGLDPTRDRSVSERIAKAIASVPCSRVANPDVVTCGNTPDEDLTPHGPASERWTNYFRKTLDLSSNSNFLGLVQERGFSPVKISWEDIGRYQGSVWGDRISDVGIWVRQQERDPASAELALSVRRDANFSDKVLMVPSEKIKIHIKSNGRIEERSLPERLRELGLTSKERDKHVIVSNQFAIVPVPSRNMHNERASDSPPRSAFNFSIFPFGSTNFVITDVIEGSHEAVVGPGTHQLLFANVNGEKAPFTASRATDRQDLLDLEQELKSRGMDADVQRYYLVQIPLKREASGIALSNMGTPPWRNRGIMGGGMVYAPGSEPVALAMESAASDAAASPQKSRPHQPAGLSKVAIGTGAVEGPYHTGSGFRGQRAEEPIRVTVVYFVTPVGEISPADMNNFSSAFAEWDSKSVWGGSFVVPEKA